MDPMIKQNLNSFQKGAQFIDALADRGLLYHFDDEAADCLRAHNLTTEQLEAIQHNANQLFDIDWKSAGYDCPFDYLLTHHND